MNKEKAIRYLKEHGMQCGYDFNGVWAINHWVQVGTECRVKGDTIDTLKSFHEVKEWLGY